MANRDAPRGFYNPQHKTGGRQRIRTYTAGGEVFAGDPCTINASGKVIRDPTVGNSSVIPDVIALGYAAADGDTVQCYVDLGDLTFEVQVDDNSVTSIASINDTFDIIQAAGDATTLLSGAMLDGNGTNTNQLRLVDLVNRPDNDDSVTKNKVRVEFALYGTAPASS